MPTGFSDDERLFKGVPIAHIYKLGDRYRLSSAAFKQRLDPGSNRFVSSCFRERLMSLDSFVAYQHHRGRGDWGIADSIYGLIRNSSVQGAGGSACEIVQERGAEDDHDAHCHIYVARSKAALDRLRKAFEPVRPPAGLESAVWTHDL